MLPRLAVVDPELTLGLPRPVTASTGLDALTQLIEPYVSSRANAMTDLFCVEGIRRTAAALPRAWEDGGDRQARSDMAWASLLGGLSLANAGLGAVHGFAAPIGGMFPAPHGAVCAAVLPHAMAVNVGPCAGARRKRKPCAATTRSPAWPPAGPRLPRGWRPIGWPRCAAGWRFRRCAPTAWAAAHIPLLVEKGRPGQQHEGQPHRADCRGVAPHSGACDLNRVTRTRRPLRGKTAGGSSLYLFAGTARLNIAKRNFGPAVGAVPPAGASFQAK